MDKTLREYLDLAEGTNIFLEKNAILTSNKQIEEKIITLHLGIKTIQAVAKRMADISNMITQYLLSRNKKIEDNKIIDIYPTEYDHAVLRNLYPIKEEQKQILPNNSSLILPIKTVNSISEIPISKIYYITALKQYAINIEGLIIKGNLGNILDYQSENTTICKYGINCKNFINLKKCNYYHEPEDYIKMSREVPDEVRNFTVGSWVYKKNKSITHNSKLKNNYHRNVGSFDTLLDDLAMLKNINYNEEVNNREGQLIHDLLIYCILNNKNFIHKYKQW
jgi:hypothetical protein